MKARCAAEAPIPFDLHLAHENRVARECARRSARRVTPCPPVVRAPRVEEVPRGTPAPKADAPRPDAPRLADAAPVPVRLKVERVETTYRVRQFMPRGSMVDVVI